METHAELFLLSLEIVQRYAQPRLIPLLRSVVDLLEVEAAGRVEGGAVTALPGVEGVVREEGGGQLEEGGRGV